MINISYNRKKYIIYPTVPLTTEEIGYEVTIGGNLVFVGRSRYFGGVYEVDTRDWIDSYISKSSTLVTSVTVQIDFVFYLEDSTTSTQTKTLTYTPEIIGLRVPPQDWSATYCNIELGNCGFMFNGGTAIRVPLDMDGLTLKGKTIDKLEKVTYIDKYGDTHNGSMVNKYELECFIDPCWFQVTTNNDLEYEKVMLALQNAQTATLKGLGINNTPIKISGMDTSYSLRPSQTREIPPMDILIEGRVKDVQKIETYSSYSAKKKLPTYKITFECYR